MPHFARTETVLFTSTRRYQLLFILTDDTICVRGYTCRYGHGRCVVLLYCCIFVIISPCDTANRTRSVSNPCQANTTSRYTEPPPDYAENTVGFVVRPFFISISCNFRRTVSPLRTCSTTLGTLLITPTPFLRTTVRPYVRATPKNAGGFGYLFLSVALYKNNSCPFFGQL